MEHIDVHFAPPTSRHALHNRHQVVQKYTTAMRQLRALAEQRYRLHYFDQYMLQQYFEQFSSSSLADQETDENNRNQRYYSPLAYFKLELLRHILDRRRQILYWLFYLMLAFLCVFAYRHESSAAVAERSVQSIVYPGMRMWRRITLPLIQRFPRLTELYDESCLMENPFFQLEDLSCEPCALATNVVDVTLESLQTTDSSLLQHNNDDVTLTPIAMQKEFVTEFVPFVFKLNQTPIQLEDFYAIYDNNKEIFQRDAFRVQSTNRDVTNLEELFGQFNQSSQWSNQSHNMWRCNRMLPARLLRPLFARHERLPRTGAALERYITIDAAQAPAYTLPDTECANVYVQQALGARFIVLRPTSACKNICRTLSIRLPQSFVLSYNWWYWKPVSTPDPVADTLSVSLIGSYC